MLRNNIITLEHHSSQVLIASECFKSRGNVLPLMAGQYFTDWKVSQLFVIRRYKECGLMSVDQKLHVIFFFHLSESSLDGHRIFLPLS